MESLLRIQMFGRLVVRQGNRDIDRFRTQKTAALLAFLAFYKQRSHPREMLFEMFWPASDLEAARTNLSVALNALRRQFEGPGIAPGSIVISDRTQVRLNTDAFSTDVDAFETSLMNADLEEDREKRVALQVAALDLYAGDLLPGFYEDWILAERDRLRDAYLSALQQVIKHAAEMRQYERAIAWSHRMVEADLLREEAYHNLMRLYVVVGRPNDALQQYEALEQRLQKELQAVPSEPVRDLAAKLRLAGGVRHAVTSGNARESRPEVGGSVLNRPPGESVRTVVDLPVQFTRFFGQEDQIADLITLLSPANRVTEDAGDPTGNRSLASSLSGTPLLVTLTGPGGTGKTRLAIETAKRMSDRFAGGIWFVALAELLEARFLGGKLAEALSLPRKADLDHLDRAIKFLQECRPRGPMLLIFDNFEHLVESGVDILTVLRERVPELSLLVTSRRSLGLPGEREYQVKQLPVPADWNGKGPGGTSHVSLLTLMQNPSIALFLDRAQAVVSDFQLTPRNADDLVEICRHLEGLPLALELAAARVRVMTPTQIRKSMANRFDLLVNPRTEKDARHRSLHSVMEWSHNLLSPPIKCLFRRLSVFQGGFTTDAAMAVCEEPLALGYLEQLRFDSLLSAGDIGGEMRFRMLESIREYAAEQSPPWEREEMEGRHAAYYHQVACNARFVGSDLKASLRRFRVEQGNLRGVLAWSLRDENVTEIGLEIAGRMSYFWLMQGDFAEGRQWYRLLLERAEKTPTTGLGQALYGAGVLASQQGDFQAARPLLEQCMEVFASLGDDVRHGNAHNELGNMANYQGDYERAKFHYSRLLEQARAQVLKAADRREERLASALGNLANVAHATGDSAASRALNEEALEIKRRIGDRLGEAITLHNLGNLMHAEQEWDAARSYYRRSVEIKQELAERHSLISSLSGLAAVAKALGDYTTAANFVRDCLVLAREQESRKDLIYLFKLLIDLACPEGMEAIAARMYGAMMQAREEMNYPVRPIDQDEYDRIQSELRRMLGDAAYETAHSTGRQLTLEQALICLEEILAIRSM